MKLRWFNWNPFYYILSPDEKVWRDPCQVPDLKKVLNIRWLLQVSILWRSFSSIMPRENWYLFPGWCLSLALHSRILTETSCSLYNIFITLHDFDSWGAYKNVKIKSYVGKKKEIKSSFSHLKEATKRCFFPVEMSIKLYKVISTFHLWLKCKHSNERYRTVLLNNTVLYICFVYSP